MTGRMLQAAPGAAPTEASPRDRRPRALSGQPSRRAAADRLAWIAHAHGRTAGATLHALAMDGR